MLCNNPIILLSVINTKLRDYYTSLDELCDDLDFNKREIEEILNGIGYSYNAEENRFKQI